MSTSRPSTVRRALAAASTLAVAASLGAAVATGTALPAGAVDDPAASAGAEPRVRDDGRETGAFTVRGGARTEGVGLTPAAQRDLRRYARQSGEDYDGLLASHAGVDDFAEYAADLEAREPDLFTAAGIAEDGSGPWIQVTERPDAAEVARLRRLPVSVEVAYGAPASSAELAAVSEELIDAVASRSGVVESAQAAYDPEAQRVVLSVKPRATAGDARVDDTLDDAVVAAVPAGDDELPLDVLTREVAFDVDQEATVQGGANLNFRGQAACTAGFTAVRQGNRGLLTARHCPNRMTLGKQAGALAPKAAQTRDRRFDLQFHRVVTTDGRRTGVQFRAYQNGRRTVQRVVNAPQGSVVCHWGRTSKFSCARVRATNQCVFLDAQKTCGLDATRRYISAPGDSGGPWFLGNTARGIHAGGGGNTSLFTRIGKVDALRARVLKR